MEWVVASGSSSSFYVEDVVGDVGGAAAVRLPTVAGQGRKREAVSFCGDWYSGSGREEICAGSYTERCSAACWVLSDGGRTCGLCSVLTESRVPGFGTWDSWQSGDAPIFVPPYCG